MDILTSVSASSTLPEADRLNMLNRLVAFLCVFPFNPADIGKMPFQLQPSFADQLSLLRCALDIPANMSKDKIEEVVELVVTLERGPDPTERILNTFVAAPDGVRLLRASKATLSSLQSERDSSHRLQLYIADLTNEKLEHLGQTRGSSQLAQQRNSKPGPKLARILWFVFPGHPICISKFSVLELPWLNTWAPNST